MLFIFCRGGGGEVSSTVGRSHNGILKKVVVVCLVDSVFELRLFTIALLASLKFTVMIRGNSKWVEGTRK